MRSMNRTHWSIVVVAYEIQLGLSLRSSSRWLHIKVTSELLASARVTPSDDHFIDVMVDLVFYQSRDEQERLKLTS